MTSSAPYPSSPRAPYSEWIAALLRHLHLPPPPVPEPAVTTLHFEGKATVHVAGKAGQVDLMSEAGQLRVPFAADSLLALLALNRCEGAADPISVTVDAASGTVIVWARLRQQALDAAGAVRLVQGVRRKVEAVQKVLGRPATHAPERGAAVLARMLARPAVSAL